jgi:PKD repeat protein
MRRHVCVALTIGALAVNCSDSTPTQPTPTPGTGDGPAARLAITIDSLRSSEAVSDLSNVTVDASESSGTGLTYRVEFGDGATASEAVARHVYPTTGTFTTKVTVTDAGGRTSTASRDVVVASPVGTWLYSGYLTRTRQVEVRTLSLTAQDGRTVRGVLAAAGRADRTVTGTLSEERGVQIVLDDGTETLEGTLPGVLSGESVRWTLSARGGPADGERLEFVRRRGEASGAPPDAVLKMRFFSFGAPFGVQGYSPILFDGSTSRGEGLQYFIEFGDSEFTAEPSAVHPISKAGIYTARLTVVDSFGRSDQEAQSFKVRSLTLLTDDYNIFPFWQGSYPWLDLAFSSQEGREVSGRVRSYVLGDRRFTGTLSGEGDLRLVLDGTDIILTGTLRLSGRTQYDWTLVLTQTGGTDHGKSFQFIYRDYYS